MHGSRFPDFSPEPDRTGFHRAPVLVSRRMGTHLPLRYPGFDGITRSDAPLTVADQRRDFTGFPSRAVLLADGGVTIPRVPTTRPWAPSSLDARQGPAPRSSPGTERTRNVTIDLTGGLERRPRVRLRRAAAQSGAPGIGQRLDLGPGRRSGPPAHRGRGRGRPVGHARCAGQRGTFRWTDLQRPRSRTRARRHSARTAAPACSALGPVVRVDRAVPALAYAGAGDAASTTVQDQIGGAFPGQGERIPVEIEIDLWPAAPPWMNGAMLAEAKRILDTQEEGDLMGHPWRFEQLCRATGSARIGDEAFAVNGGANRIRRQSIRRLAKFRGTRGRRHSSRAGAASPTSPTRPGRTARRRTTRATSSRETGH